MCQNCFKICFKIEYAKPPTISNVTISNVILKPHHRAASGSCSFKDFVLAGSKKTLFSFQNIGTKHELRYMPGACDDVM